MSRQSVKRFGGWDMLQHINLARILSAGFHPAGTRARKENLLAEQRARCVFIGRSLRGGEANHAAGGERQQHKSHKNTTQKLRIGLNRIIQNSSPHNATH
jgi:hypothetical protein